MSGENAGHWLRVSSHKQDEESQFPDILRWSDTHGYSYSPETTYQVHGASARKGNRKFDAAWARVLEDFRTGKITVLVVWYLSRLDRKLAATRMIAQVVELGGRIEFVKQPHLNNLSTMAGRISLKVEEEIAFAESEEKSARVKAKQDALRAQGSIANGYPPWGYGIVKLVDGRKILAPTDLGRTWIPRIFDACINGKSGTQIGQMLTDAGVKTTRGNVTWHESYIMHKILKNSTYAGIRPNSGAMEVEALVTVDVFKAAAKALESRKRNTRGTSVREPALLQPFCGNPDCDATRQPGEQYSPMHRIYSGPEGYKTAYYRCTGKGPNRKGCGAPMVPCAELDEFFTDLFSKDTRPYTVPVYHPAVDNTVELAAVTKEIARASAARDYVKLAELAGKAKELEDSPVTPGWTEDKDTGMTRAKYFESCDVEGKREFLAGWLILASKPDGVLKVSYRAKGKLPSAG